MQVVRPFKINIFIMCTYNSLSSKRNFIINITNLIIPGPYLDGSITNKKIVLFLEHHISDHIRTSSAVLEY